MNTISDIMQLKDRLMRYSLQLTKDRSQAQDLFQETLMRIYLHQDKYLPGTNLYAWASTVMRNIFINLYHKSSRRRTLMEQHQAPQEQAPIGRNLNQGQLQLEFQDIWDLVEQLPDLHKQPFLMYYSGYAYREIADTLGVPTGTIKSRIFDARAKLKQQLQRLDHPAGSRKRNRRRAASA